MTDPMHWPGYRCARCGGANEQVELRRQLAEALELLADDHLAYAGNPWMGEKWIQRRDALLGEE